MNFQRTVGPHTYEERKDNERQEGWQHADVDLDIRWYWRDMHARLAARGHGHRGRRRAPPRQNRGGLFGRGSTV